MRMDNPGALVEDESTDATSVRGVQQRRRRPRQPEAPVPQIFHTGGGNDTGDVATRRSGEGYRPKGDWDQPAPAPNSLRTGRQHNRLCAVCSWSIALRATRPVRHAASIRAPPPGQLVSVGSQSSPKWCKRSGRYTGAAGVSAQGILLDCENVRPRVRRVVHRFWTSRGGLTASGDDADTMVEPRASCRGGCDNEPMTKSELIQRIAQAQPELVERDVAMAVNMMLEHMSACLCDGGRIEIRGFGSFSLRFRRARVGRNPRTGTAVSLPARYAPYFKPGKGLRERLNRPHESTHDGQ